MTDIIGYACAILIGVSLGLIGGGGSILTVPVLVYILGISPVMATAYSLFVVGVSSLVGGARYATKRMVDFRAVFVFGLPSIVAVFFTRKFIVPAIPEKMALAGFILDKGVLLMVLFAMLMCLASYSMVKKSWRSRPPVKPEMNTWKVLLILGEGMLVGTLTGLVGAGGGFLIIPALIMFMGLHMKIAIGTSLVIIATKSLIGFLGDVSNYVIDWQFLIAFSGFAIIGILIGSYFANLIDGKKLQAGFGWFTMVMAALILLRELVF